MNTIIKKMSLFALPFFLFSKSIFGQTANPILGKWRAAEDTSRQVEMYQTKDGLYYAKVINSSDKNAKNGHNLLQKLVYDAQKNSFKGKLVPPDKGIEIDATVRFDNANKLKVVGKKFFMTKTFYFIRL
jgi:uncharacterized protein (DUF2147 family)